jgi:hypothetical protein
MTSDLSRSFPGCTAKESARTVVAVGRATQEETAPMQHAEYATARRNHNPATGEPA